MATIGSPTNRTTSPASNGRGIVAGSRQVERDRRGQVEVGGGDHAEHAGASTAASEVSMPAMRAWAMVERT